MKNVWKNLCVIAMACICAIGFVGCQGDEQVVAKDLDGDGVISSWEMPFEDSEVSSEGGEGITVTGDIEHISSVQQLLAIDDKVGFRKIYILDRDIDLGGKEICINLGMSEFYGNGHTIKNFALGTYHEEKYEEVVEGEEQTVIPSGTRCLFYGGALVYNLRLFVGYQRFYLTDAELASYTISPFVNTLSLSGVSVKGKLDVTAPKVDGAMLLDTEISLVYSNIGIYAENEEGFLTPQRVDTTMEHIYVDGNIKLRNEAPLASSTVGAIASSIFEDSSIINSYAKVDISIDSNSTCSIGGIIGQGWGFVSSAVATGKIYMSSRSGMLAQSVGAIAGSVLESGELKDCVSNMTITATGDNVSNSSQMSIGGIVGDCESSVVECAQSDTHIIASGYGSIFVGGIAGASIDGIISYAICRGDINISRSQIVCVAQVSGASVGGLFEKIMTTTAIRVDRLETSRIYVGMVTVFEVSYSEMGYFDGVGEFDGVPPYFQRVLVDGVTEIVGNANGTVYSNLGLRSSFKKTVGTTGEDSDYICNFPIIFSDVYYTGKGGISTTGCVLKIDGNTVTPEYARDEQNNLRVQLYSGTNIKGIIERFDFKNFLNHNEVNIVEDMTLSGLYFTLTDKQIRSSYFSENAYSNVGWAYIDERHFTESYIHEGSSVGGCSHDEDDKYLSFLYNLIDNDSKSKINCAFMVSGRFLNGGVVGDDLPDSDSQVEQFISVTRSVFNCINTPVTITRLDSQLQNLEDPELTLETDSPAYVKFEFADSENSYSLLFDVRMLKDTLWADSFDYIIYLVFSVVSNPTRA